MEREKNNGLTESIISSTNKILEILNQEVQNVQNGDDSQEIIKEKMSAVQSYVNNLKLLNNITDANLNKALFKLHDAVIENIVTLAAYKKVSESLLHEIIEQVTDKNITYAKTQQRKNLKNTHFLNEVV